MSDQPLVSVVLPFHNAPNLHIAIESILAQTHSLFELILVDNNGTEASGEIAEGYAKEDRVRLIKEPKQGVVFAMNQGIRNAQGSFVARMDADDFSFPDRLESQLRAFALDPELGVVSGGVEYHGAAEFEGFRQYVAWLNQIRTNYEISLNQFVEFPLVNPSLMFRSSLFRRFGVYEEGDFPEDYAFFLRLQQHGVKMQKVSNTVLRWSDSPGRLTRVDQRYSTDAFFRVKAEYLAVWLKEKNPHHPDILVWGAGRLSRKRSAYLKDFEIKITGYIDVVQKKDRIHFEQIPPKETCFIVSYVANRGAREEIRSFLVAKGFQEGTHFILAS